MFPRGRKRSVLPVGKEAPKTTSPVHARWDFIEIYIYILKI